MNREILKYSYQLKKEKQRKAGHTIFFVFILFVLVTLILSFLIFPVRQVSDSMLPDIPKNGFVMCSPIVTKCERGDVVLINSRYHKKLSAPKHIFNLAFRFFTAQQFSLTENDRFPGTKSQLRRIVAVPGDTFYMRDYVVYVKPSNGEKHFLTEFEVSQKPYNVTFYAPPASWDGSIGVKGSFDEITLGEDEYFVLSDYRKDSDDSRLWGVVKRSQINAKALVCYFPFNKFRFF